MTADCRVCRREVDKPIIRPDVKVARLAAHQWGVLCLDELRSCGLSRDAIETRVRNGHLHPLYRGVYAVGHAKLSRQAACLAAVKACGPTAVLSHYSAAALYGLVPWDDRHPEVTTKTLRAHRGIRVHRSQTIDRTHHQGIPITTPARTLIDLAATLDYAALRRAVREAQRKLTTIPQILNTLDHLGPRPGAANLTKILATGPAPTRSELEDTLLDLLLNAGFVPPQVNVPMHLNDRTIIPDFRWPTHHLVIEADGAEWHDDPLTRHHDAEKQAILEAAGERVIRITWHQATTQRPQTIQRIEQAGAPKLADLVPLLAPGRLARR